MTIDDVVLRTGSTLGVLIVTAALAWALLPIDDANIGRSYGIGIGAALIGMVLAFVQSFKRKASPALILTYAAFEGVFLGSSVQHRRQPHRRRCGHAGGDRHHGGLRRGAGGVEGGLDPRRARVPAS
ncbi:hypothetical protein SALBM311S_02667 [Streptomyces alboniger]